VLAPAALVGSPQRIAPQKLSTNVWHYLGSRTHPRPRRCRDHFLRAIEYHRPEDFAAIPLANPILGALIIGGANEWLLGYPEKALQYTKNALALARDKGNPTLGAFALTTSCYVHRLRRDYERTLEASDEGIRLATAAELPLLNTLGIIYNAWAQAQRGGGGTAHRIREALAQFDGMNFNLARGGFLGLLGETQALTGESSTP